MNRQQLILASVVVLWGATCNGASFFGLGDLAGGEHRSGAWGVSADGRVIVGHAEGANGTRAFRWTAEEGMRELDGLPPEFPASWATGVSGDGSVIAGAVADEFGNQAFRWTPEGGHELMGVVNDGHLRAAEGLALSSDGSVIVGFSMAFNGRGMIYEATRWTRESGNTRLFPLATTDEVFSRAVGVSFDGRVVVATSGAEAALWSAETGRVGLGPGPGFDHSCAADISGDGRVVIAYSFIDGPGPTRFAGYRWTAASGMQEIEPPVGWNSLIPWAISGDGSVIVGAFGDGSTYTPFVLETDGHSQSLIKILDSLNVNAHHGWKELNPLAVSADGRTIVGTGMNPLGDPEAWVAVIPSPGTAVVMAPMLAIARRRRLREQPPPVIGHS